VSEQGEQTSDGAGLVTEPPVIMDGGLVRSPRIAFSVPITARRLADMLAQRVEITGEAVSAQGSQSADGAGEVKLVPSVEGTAASSQPVAEVIAIGSVDNRRPRNIRKAKLAAALLAA
jgi:hypothetical protein